MGCDPARAGSGWSQLVVRRRFVPRLGAESLWGRFHRRFRQTFRRAGEASDADPGCLEVACSGDSGGPNFLGGGSDETNVIAGITATGDTWCKATNVDLRMDTDVSRRFLDDFVALP